MKKYLLFGVAATLALAIASAQQQVASDDLFAEGKAYNDDVSKKINLALDGVVEVSTDVTFKTGKGVGREPYYYVIPADLHDGHLVSIQAVLSNTQEEVSIK
jgi:hypothetical protein